MYAYTIILCVNNVEMKALKQEVFDVNNTKNELCDEIHRYKQSLKTVEGTLLRR